MAVTWERCWALYPRGEPWAWESIRCSVERCPRDPSELREEALALSRKLGDRNREDYVQMAQSLQGGRSSGTRGEADKGSDKAHMQ